MKEQRRFLMPADRWDTDLLESWLEDMGARGWLPVKCGARTVTFEKAKACPCRFRLDPLRQPDPERQREMEHFYAQMGWQRRCSLGDYAVYVCFDQTAPELFTDPETENWIQAKLLRMEQIAMAGSVLFAAVGLALWVWMWLGRSTPVEDLLHDSHLWDMALLLPLVAVYGTIRGIAQARRVHCLRRQAQAGLPRSHGGNWRKSLRWAQADRAMLLLVIWLPIAALVWQYSNFQRADLPPDGELPPYVAAENLDPTLTGGSGWYTVESNPLLKNGYEVWEWSEDWQIHTICDCPRLELLAELLYSERLETLLEESGGTAQQMVRSGLDQAITAETEQGETLLLRAGTAVLLVETEGVARLTDHLDDYAAVLADFQ